MKKFLVVEDYNFNDVFLEVVVAKISAANEDDAMKQAEGMTPRVVLEDGKLLIKHLNGELSVILDDEKQSYQFQICTKSSMPLDLTTLSVEEICALINDHNYHTGPEDYKNLEWTISEAYAALKELYPNRELYVFNSLAYGVREV